MNDRNDHCVLSERRHRRNCSCECLTAKLTNQPHIVTTRSFVVADVVVAVVVVVAAVAVAAAAATRNRAREREKVSERERIKTQNSRYPCSSFSIFVVNIIAAVDVVNL